MKSYDFSGWATRNNVKCSDGRVILKDAFLNNDGQTVPLVWNHQHNDPLNVLGHALLENREDGVYAYCTFNDTEAGQASKELVQHGDVVSLSIYANQLKQQRGNVSHGVIREVSLVLAGANPEAYIEQVIRHGEDMSDEEAYIFTNEDIELAHSEEGSDNNSKSEESKNEPAKEAEKEPEKEPEKEKETVEETKGRTVKDVVDSMNEEQQTVFYAMLAQAAEDAVAHSDEFNENDENEGGNTTMKHNVFDQDTKQNSAVLTHSDEKAILALAKTSAVGSFKAACKMYIEDHKDTLAHGFVDEEGNNAIAQLFPDYKDVHPGAPELLERDQSWVGLVMRKAHKSPISRIRTRQADARAKELRAKGYNNREEEKALSGNIKLLMRTTDPQTVYRRDEMHRDDINDITEFDPVAYIKTVMKHNIEEDIALASLVGDGRDDADPDKIHENHIRPIWKDEELYTIHQDVNIEKAREELQGTETGAHFGDNYIYSEAIITAALYAREKYKGKGQLDFYCTPHLLNVMLLARDLNGRRIYDSKSDLAKALNVGEIVTVEQFEGLTRSTKDGKTKKLLGLFVNMGNYQFGSTKGGELTSFEDFDIDFNMYKYLMETRLSGALTEVYSAIALEEDVTEAAG